MKMVTTITMVVNSVHSKTSQVSFKLYGYKHVGPPFTNVIIKAVSGVEGGYETLEMLSPPLKRFI